MSNQISSKSNVVSLFPKQKESIKEQTIQTPRNGLKSGKVLKSSDLHKDIQLNPYTPPSFSPTYRTGPSAALKELRENFNLLNDLQSRLRFMINELEELSQN